MYLNLPLEVVHAEERLPQGVASWQESCRVLCLFEEVARSKQHTYVAGSNNLSRHGDGAGPGRMGQRRA